MIELVSVLANLGISGGSMLVVVEDASSFANFDLTAPMGERAAELYDAFAGLGKGSTDFSGIIKMLDQ